VGEVSPAVTAIAAHRVRVPFRTPFATAAGAWTSREALVVLVREDDGRQGVGESDAGDTAWAAALDAARLDLGPVPPAPPWVGVNATIGATGADAAVTAAVEAVGAGFRTLKLKAGAGEPQDALVARLGAVRRAVGEGIALRLDVNGAWDLAGATDRLRALEPIGIAYVEQPLPPALVAEAAALRRSVGIPIAADEAVTSETSARTLLDAGAADVLVVKPARVGGPTVVAAIAAMAAERGVPVVVSSMFETGVGLAAGLACAAALPDVPGWATAERDHGLATADLLEDDLIVDPLVVEAGRMRAPGGPGSGALGVRLDEAALARYAVTDR
jgi:L-Ala-D/L-Glu epimerase